MTSKEKQTTKKMSSETGSRERKPSARVSLSPINFFPFQWQYEDVHIDDEGKCLQTMIHIYGWNEKNESVHLRIEDFPIPIWVELPDNIEWTDNRFEIIQRFLSSLNKDPSMNPKSIMLEYKQPLYFASIEEDLANAGKYKNKLYPYLQVTFRNTKAVDYFSYRLKNEVYVPGIEKMTLKCHCYEKSTTPIIKLLAWKQLPSANWIYAKGTYIDKDNRQTTKQHEYVCSFKHLKSHPDSDTLPIVYPKVLSFDNEAYSSNSGSMPKSDEPKDVVFMIGCTICSIKDKKKVYDKYLLVIGECDPVEGAKVISFKSELQLFVGFTRFIKEHDPDVIIGYNIFGWDIKYMVERANKLLFCNDDFQRMGCMPMKVCPVMNECWESSAYGKQDLTYIECDGRLFIDMLPYVQRNFKLSNYRLETVCDEFLKNTNKDPLKAKDIFRLYESKRPDDLSLVAKYCIQDSYVTILLYDKLLTWFDLTETATTNGVPIFYIYTKGQQIKMYSQMLKYCVKNNIVVESNAYKVSEDEQYVGATVTEPRAGLYKSILPFDFASLYPSIIMAYGIDMSKLVDDRNGINGNIPDEFCNVISWIEHFGCVHDTKKRAKGKDGKSRVICTSYRYRFLKPDVTGKGVIPTLLESLLKARKDTRKIIAKNEEEVDRLRELGNEESNQKADELEAMNLVLDKRQLSYKVSANSMYGAMGVKQGKLPFLPGAMCTTYIGRVSIMKASRFLEEECGGQVIYNDTDSAYTYFPALQGKSSEEIWQFAEDVVKRVAKLFPAPMKLEFEDKVYHKFLILTKKRYVAQPISRDGKIESKLFKRGVVLQRRDNCPLLRDIYQTVVWYILDHIDALTSISREASRDEILRHPVVAKLLSMVTDGITDALFEFKHSYKNFVITKALKQETYKTKQPPAHVFVAQKMRERGIFVPQNSRIEYVLLDRGEGYQKKVLQYTKTEDVNFYVDNKESLRLDYLYYLEKQFVKPLNEILKVVIYQPKLMKEHLQHRIYKSQMLTQMKGIFRPRYQFYEDLSFDWKQMSLYDFLYTYGGMPYQYTDFFQQDNVKDEIKTISDALQRDKRVIYPELPNVFRALSSVNGKPKVVILGQDPYHNGAACGLAFSVEYENEPLNKSLINIHKEIVSCGFDVDPSNGRLDLWCKEGVMLLNTALTVIEGEAGIHCHLWKNFTRLLLDYLQPEVGLLWGNHAIDYASYFKETVCTSHPSPLGAYKPVGHYPAFLGSRCFHQVNKILQKKKTRVYWNTIEKSFEPLDPKTLKD